MKIAQVCPYFFPVEGGVEKHVYSISRELARRGHEVHIHTSARTRDSTRLASEQQVDGLFVHRYEPVGNLGEFGSIWPSFAVGILAGGYDVVHSHVLRHPHTDISAIVSKVAGSRSVLTSHSPFHPAQVRLPLARGLVNLYDKLVAPLTLKIYDVVISLTPAESNKLRALGVRPDRLVVIPNGVDSMYFDLPADDDKMRDSNIIPGRMLLYLGRINRTKGLDVLIRAFFQISGKFSDVQLVIAGPATSPQEAAYRNQLETLASTLHIKDRVVFMGYLSEDAKVAFMRSCIALVLPSLYEPFGIVILEAAALGKPVITTLTDGPASIVQDGVSGLLVPPSDAEGLGICLSRILTEPGLISSMSAGARANAQGYRWERIVDRIEAAYLKADS